MFNPTLSSLLNASKTYHVQDAEYLVVIIEGNAPAPEIIVNPKKNFKSKLEYYEKAYNEDLTLKNNTDIRITGFYFVDNNRALQDLLVELV